MISSSVIAPTHHVLLGIVVYIDLIYWCWVCNKYIDFFKLIWNTIIVAVNSTLCIASHIACPANPHIHIQRACSHCLNTVVLFLIFPPVIWGAKKEKWGCSFPSVTIQFYYVWNHQWCHDLFLILRCCVLDIFPCWICCCYISLSKSDIILYMDIMPQSVVIISGLYTTINWNLSN